MASFETLRKLAENPDWLPPRSDVRVFLGEPGAPEATKTTVEPGNVFSPGMMSFGVTWWLRLPGGIFFATEDAPLDALHWRYEAGYLPIIHCETIVDSLGIRHSLFQDGTASERNEAVAGRLCVTNLGNVTRSVEVYLALRSLGPAGGPIPDLAITSDKCGFARAGKDQTLLAFAEPPSAIGVGIGDPSPLARAGEMPDLQDRLVRDAQGWCFGMARFDLTLGPDMTSAVHFDCPQQARGSLAEELPNTAHPHPGQFEERAQAHLKSWRSRFEHLSLDTPDTTFNEAYFAGLGHMLTAMVGDQARIAALSYPLPWLRDSVYIIHALDLAGMHDVARAATQYCARHDFFGGFGAEGDAPGQGIWALVGHYRLTHDKVWLAEVYPAIQRKAEWLFRMRRADAPIQVTVDTPVLAFTHGMRASGIICLPAQHGIIMGSMDHGVTYALGWVNQWALAGLREAAFAAKELGHSSNAVRFQREADALGTALEAYVVRTPQMLSEERTVNSLLWPTGAWLDSSLLPTVAAAFGEWWQQSRLAENASGRREVFVPEPYWLYFEAAQAHNALWLGDALPAWQVLDYRLSHQDVPGLYGWREGGNGVGTENAMHGVTLINQLRGCQKLDSITPHGWSQAEIWLLQRALLIEERGSELVIFSGIPARWLKPGARIGFSGFPTMYGNVSASLDVSADGAGARYRVKGVTAGTRVRIRVDGKDAVYVSEVSEHAGHLHFLAQ